MQAVLEVDHSSGHMKNKPDALSPSGLNTKWGGKQRKMRASVLIEGCLGQNPPNVHGKVLHVGDTQEMQFKEVDDPPFYDLQAQDYIGKQKGIFQILFERGLYIEVMIKGYTPAQLNEKILNGEPIKSEDYQAALVMEGLPDFLNEKSALEEIS